MQIVGYVLACKSYSFVCTLHHLIIIIAQTLSEDIGPIKCLSDIFCRMCQIKHIIPVIHYTTCVAVCFFSLPISFVMIERIYIYFVLLSSSNGNGMRCMSFSILVNDNFGLCLLWAGCHEK